MADTKITALTALTAADPANDVIPIVDVSDTSMAASGTTKKISVNNILGASGTATLASATITGDLTVATNVLKVDSALNKVGIGVATLTGLSTLNVAGDIALTSDLVVKNSGGTVQGYIFGSSGLNYRVVASNPHVWQEGGTDLMRLNSTGLGVGASPSYQLHVAKSQASQTAIYVDNQQNNAAASSALTLSAYGGYWNLSVPQSSTFVNPLIFKFGSTEMMRMTSVGDIVLAGGNTSANGVGITFPATQVASSDANTLDDYEEGTWAIGLEFGGASTGITTNSNQGKYTKIGNQVTINGYLALSNKGSSTGNAVITGLPFLANGYTAVSLYMAQITFADVPMGFSNNGTSTIILRESTNAGVSSTLTNADFANNSEIMFNMTYFV